MAAVGAEVHSSQVSVLPEQAAFVAKLFERHSVTLLWYLTRMTPNIEDAEEVLQEAYLRLLNAGGLDAEDSRARNYLFTTAKNLARDSFRRRKARCEHLHVDIDTLDMGSEDPCPEDWVDWNCRLLILRAALKELLPRSREAFLLHCNECMTYQCIADRLGVSRKTIERDIAMVMQFCRARLSVSSSV